MKVLLYRKDSLDEYKTLLQPWLPVIPQEHGPKGLLLLERGGEHCCIFDPLHSEAAAFAQEQRLNCLSCGFSPYDSLVLSSHIPGQAVITLQRQLLDLSGQPLEPGDRLIHLGGEVRDHQLLLSCGALLLAGILRGDEFFLFQDRSGENFH